MEMSDIKYGSRFWCVKTHLSKSGEIRLLADKVDIAPDGTIMFLREVDGVMVMNLCLSSGRWSSCYGASMIDGHPVAVDHWEGELD